MRLRKLLTLGGAERTVALQAALLAPVAGIALRLASLGRAVRFVARFPGPDTDVPVVTTAGLVDAATTALGASCLTRSLVLHAVLTRQGRASTVVIGAARDDGGMRAHAWVEWDGRVVSADGDGACAPLHRVEAGSTARVPAA